MISRVDLRGKQADADTYRDVLPRAALDVGSAVDVVRPICDDVRARGADAVREATSRLDGVDVARHPGAGRRAGPRAGGPRPRGARRARGGDPPGPAGARGPAAQRTTTVEVVPGGTVTERWLPVRRVGLYVPGGLLAYPSSVVMNVVPAQVAGVRSLAVASPPQAEYGGLPHPSVLAACALLGIDEVHAVGGAQAVAMFAYGTADCERVDLVTGPGNVYVAAAKRLLRGVVGIDAEAGPTEIAILADDTADPRHVAADLIAQAEHDPNASCLLVTPSTELLDAVDRELGAQVAATRHRDRVETALRNQSAHVLVDDLEQGLTVVDAWAAEHLEVLTRDARAWADRVTGAGAIFVGPYSPVSLGDYLAGSNHVLPTGGTARHTGGLSVQSFLHGVHVVEYDEAALAGAAAHIDALGGAEDLPAHVAAVRVRVPRAPE